MSHEAKKLSCTTHTARPLVGTEPKWNMNSMNVSNYAKVPKNLLLFY